MSGTGCALGGRLLPQAGASPFLLGNNPQNITWFRGPSPRPLFPGQESLLRARRGRPASPEGVRHRIQIARHGLIHPPESGGVRRCWRIRRECEVGRPSGATASDSGLRRVSFRNYISFNAETGASRRSGLTACLYSVELVEWTYPRSPQRKPP